MHKYFIIVIIVFLQGCVVKDIQTNSENIHANSENLKNVTSLVNKHHETDATKKLLAKAKSDLIYSTEAMLKEKGLLGENGKAIAIKTAQVAGGLLGIPPAVSEGVIGFIMLLVGGKVVRDKVKKREVLLAEAKPEDARKLL